MIRPSALLALLVAVPAVAGELEEFVQRSVEQHRSFAVLGPAAADTPGAALWSERRPGQPPLAPEFSPPGSLAPLVKAVRPGVVNLSTTNAGASRSLGSGFLISPDGLVVTNNHVIDRAQEIRVRLADGRELSAALVGRDPQTDLALLRLAGLPGGRLPTVYLGDSDLLEVGDWVVAIGNPFGLDTSVTHGLISARERVIGVGPFDDFIQTNALINPGNSGGPLFNMRGEVVGVTTAIVSQGQGIGFAVPINLVKDLLPNLLDNGRVERGWLGLSVAEARVDGQKVALVTEVFGAGPAERAGVQPGDQVVRVGGKGVTSYLQLLRRIALQAPGTVVKLSLLRKGKAVEVSATLASSPSRESIQALAGEGRIDALGLAVRAGAAVPGAPRGGVLIAAVMPDGPAALAGLLAGDLLVEANKRPITEVAELRAALDELEADAVVLLKFARGDSQRYVALKRR